MSKGKKAGGLLAAVAIGVAVFFIVRNAGADDGVAPRPDFDPGPKPDPSDNGGGEPDGFAPDPNDQPKPKPKPVPEGMLDEFIPSVKTCNLTGQHYNAARWDSPASVADGLRTLGYSIPYVGKSAGLETSDGRAEIKVAQAELMMLGLHPHDEDYIDGTIGACTLVALDKAWTQLQQGNWYRP